MIQGREVELQMIKSLQVRGQFNHEAFVLNERSQLCVIELNRDRVE